MSSLCQAFRVTSPVFTFPFVLFVRLALECGRTSKCAKAKFRIPISILRILISVFFLARFSLFSLVPLFAALPPIPESSKNGHSHNGISPSNLSTSAPFVPEDFTPVASARRCNCVDFRVWRVWCHGWSWRRVFVRRILFLSLVVRCYIQGSSVDVEQVDVYSGVSTDLQYSLVILFTLCSVHCAFKINIR